jgi:hypothetical protein
VRPAGGALWSRERRAGYTGSPRLLTDDLDSLRVQLERAGFEVIFDREVPGYRRSYTRDPFGNRIELMQPD